VKKKMVNEPADHEKILLKSGSALKPQDDNTYCSLPRRLLVILYDSIIMLGILMIASAIALPVGNTDKLAFKDFWFTLWLLVACFAYLGSCWRYGGMTIGMRAWRVRLISSDKPLISWPMCVLRFLIGLISVSVLGLGILWALVDHKNRTWHDLAAHTILIRTT
jgi:uncharacterized RDD family membrane protein YckC